MKLRNVALNSNADISRNYLFFLDSYIPTKSRGAIINGGNPASRVQLAIMERKKGKRNFGHSINRIFSRISLPAFSIENIPL